MGFSPTDWSQIINQPRVQKLYQTVNHTFYSHVNITTACVLPYICPCGYDVIKSGRYPNVRVIYTYVTMCSMQWGVKPGLWTGLDSRTEIWTGFWYAGRWRPFPTTNCLNSCRLCYVGCILNKQNVPHHSGQAQYASIALGIIGGSIMPA